VLAYLREEDLEFIDPQMRLDLPVIQTTPNSLKAVLRSVLRTPRKSLVDLGRRSRAFVERWHDPMQIAALIKSDYELAIASKESKVS
jgi:hypothetical protein